MSVRPGDITVTPSAGEYAIARVQDAGGRTARTLERHRERETALNRARRFAEALGVGAWTTPSSEAPELILAAPAPSAQSPHPRVFDEAEAVWHPFDFLSVDRYTPNAPGLYVFRAAAPVLIGESDNLYVRLLHHLQQRDSCIDVLRPLEFACLVVLDDDIRRGRHAALVARWAPVCNQAGSGP